MLYLHKFKFLLCMQSFSCAKYNDKRKYVEANVKNKISFIEVSAHALLPTKYKHSFNINKL